MLTYGDMVTLLLCLFVLLFAYSSVNAIKFIAVKQSMAATFNTPAMFSNEGGKRGFLTGGPGSAGQIDALKTGPIPRIVKRIKHHILTTPMKDLMDIHHQRNQIRVRMASNELFHKGDAVLRRENEEVLLALAPLFREMPARMFRFVGHTDADPITKKDFPTNWELSSARAAAVARFYMEQFSVPPEKVTVEGRASFEPLYPNDTEINKSKNRRVEIIITSADDVASETGKIW